MMYVSNACITNNYINMAISCMINCGFLFSRIVSSLFHYRQLISSYIYIRYWMLQYTWKYEEDIFHQQSFGTFSIKVTIDSIYFYMAEIMSLLPILPGKPDTSINYARLTMTYQPFATDSHRANDKFT